MKNETVTKHITKVILLTGSLLCLAGNAAAQVTIGMDAPPNEGAMLDLKEHTSASAADRSTADKGMLFPRVKLTDLHNLLPMFESVSGTDYVKKNGAHCTKADEDASHTGLVVYNTNATDFTEGLYFWDGTGWLRLVGNAPIHPSIESLVCGSATLTNNSLTNGEPFEAILKITYAGGNSGSYEATAPVDIGDGLWIERYAGTLALGQGEVSYRIYGTPTTPTGQTKTFPVGVIEFLGKSYCGTVVTIGQDVVVKSMQFLRKTVLLDANTTTQSELEFGNLRVRFWYDPSDPYDAAKSYLQISTNLSENVRALVWFRKTGTVDSNYQTSEGRNLYNYGSQLTLVSGAWSYMT